MINQKSRNPLKKMINTCKRKVKSIENLTDIIIDLCNNIIGIQAPKWNDFKSGIPRCDQMQFSFPIEQTLNLVLIIRFIIL